MLRGFTRAFVFAAFAVVAFAQPAKALTNAEETVEKARTAAIGMFSDPNYPALLNLVSKAKAVLIVPNMIKVGFILGGRGGNGTLLVRDDNGEWGMPAFYSLGGLSFGLQIGAQSSQLILVIMTQKGLEAVMNNKVTLGADANAAIGEVGTGAQASTGIGLKADMYAFAKSSGAFAGIALDGTVVEPRLDYNENFYGAGATPHQILIAKVMSNPYAQPLIEAMPR